MIKLTQSLKLLQIGAGDGVTDDTFNQYIQNYGWSGTLMEPLPNLYNALHSRYNNSTVIKTLNAGITFNNKYDKKIFWFDYKMFKTNLYTIYETKQAAVVDLERLSDELTLNRVQRYELLNTLTETVVEFIPFKTLIEEHEYDIIHFCQPIVNEITTDVWECIQNVAIKNNIKLISYDLPNDCDTNLCNTVNTDQFTVTNRGIAEIDITKFSVPEDYGVSKFDPTNLEIYKYRKDRNLIINNEYTLG